MSIRKKRVFISGANRGIGYGLTQLMAKSDYLVVAGYRDKGRSGQLLSDSEESDSIVPFKVDVVAEEELKSLYHFIATNYDGLDILINNAGVNIRPADKIRDLNWGDIERNFKINVGGPFLTTKHLYPLLRKGSASKVINISSSMGSIESSSGSATPYRISKASLNMLTKNQAVEYQADGITVISVHPGWVQTHMGGRSAPLTVEESVGKILRVIEQVSLENTGQFLSLEGKRLPY